MRLGFVAIRALGAFTLWSGAISAAVPEAWPREAKGKVKFAEISQKKLPQGLKFDLKTFDLRDSHPVSVCWMDLDRDGTPELLVDTHEGGTGGTFKVIFAKTASGFRRIGSWLGSITVLVPAGGAKVLPIWQLVVRRRWGIHARSPSLRAWPLSVGAFGAMARD